ncbi:tetratricopeptide repeat protein [Thermobrachium celere]|uniref:TPR Domain containing protein n=1 Tax=Thermobrachium celere DSM 8682 TaxID=941824 RepID=R7RP81_9CLOT|nr:tetratricopeptide repeat protein [Thermobrachium celere]CDF57997.1 TPR Domain containing protein [Thermobrachium celere DSM 8682]
MSYVDFYNQAVQYYKTKDYKKSIDLFFKALTYNNSYLLYYNIGVCYLELNQFKEAIDFFKKSIQKNRFFDKSYINLAYSYYKLKNYKASYRTIKEAISFIDSDHLKLIENKLYKIIILGEFK